jgi:hypothetical protein
LSMTLGPLSRKSRFMEHLLRQRHCDPAPRSFQFRRRWILAA